LSFLDRAATGGAEICMSISKGVLIAEDEDNDFLLMERAFAKNSEKVPVTRARDGVEVISYLTGADGFEDRRQFPLPGVLLLDLKMPRKGGFEVLEWIRNHPAFKPMIVIILSSSAQDKDVTNAYRLGANSYLTKPNDYAGLFELVNALVEYWLRWSQHPKVNGGSSGSVQSIPDSPGSDVGEQR
jgi:CheY-like chemotaxis protein